MEPITWLEHIAPMIGVTLPYIQGLINRVITGSKFIFGVEITESEQRIAITYLLSFVLAFIATVSTKGFNLEGIVFNMGAIFMLSQLVYRTHFVKVKK